MAKYNRLTVGSIYKGQKDDDGNLKPDYMKLRGGETATALAKALMGADPEKGIVLRLESKKSQLDSLEAAATAGKLKSDVVTKIRDRITNIPEYVRFELVLLTEKQD